jgi:hypothetical protein
MSVARNELSPPLKRATDAARQLKPGTWEGVEALAFLAVASKASPASADLYRSALDASTTLKAGNWASVRALAVLAWVAGELNAT